MHQGISGGKVLPDENRISKQDLYDSMHIIAGPLCESVRTAE